MSFFVITKQGSTSEHLDTPIFEIEDGGDQSAVAVFLSVEAAQNYLSEAGWGDTDTVAQVAPTDLLKWLTLAKVNEGVSRVFVEPCYAKKGDGELQECISLDNPQEAHAHLLKAAAESIAEA